MDTESPWLSPEQQRVWRDWLALSAQLPVVLNRDLQAASGLSLPDFDILVHLSEAGQGKVRVGDLAGALHWERSRVSHQVTRMEARGLVGREDCPDDGRGHFVVLTPEGRAAIEAAAPGHVRTVRRLVFDVLTPEELAQLGVLLRTVVHRLEAPDRRGP